MTTRSKKLSLTELRKIIKEEIAGSQKLPSPSEEWITIYNAVSESTGKAPSLRELMVAINELIKYTKSLKSSYCQLGFFNYMAFNARGEALEVEIKHPNAPEIVKLWIDGQSEEARKLLSSN